MKKEIVSLIMLVGMVFAMTAFAATTVSLSPVNVSVKEGQNFNLNVTINPQGVKNYTVKLEIKYPADTLEVKSFSFGNSWMALAQPGYDSIDNSNGVLIKTAGYPGGVNSNASFGTIVFKAKKSGDTIIQVTENSLALNADNQNVIGGLPVETRVAITPVVTITPQEQEEAEQIVTEKEIVTEEEQYQAPEPLVVERPNLFLAAISSFITLGTGNNIIGIIVLFAIAFIIYFAYSYFAKKKKSGQ